MRIYTRQEIFNAMRHRVSNAITNGHLQAMIDCAVSEAYYGNHTHNFKEIMRVVYEYYNDPNFTELESQLDRIYEQDVTELNFDDDEFEI